MPYVQRDAFHASLRDYIKTDCVGLPATTVGNYRRWMEEAGELVGFTPPPKITLSEMRMIEAEMEGNESTRSVKSSMVRHFLRYCGNRDAWKWKLSCRQRPKEDGVFFGEAQTAYIREFAAKLGNEHELIYSLGIDNGLRTIDMRRLTPDRVTKLVKYGQGMILGKGRNGGKDGMLYLSRMTFAPLIRYVDRRRELVEEFGGYDPAPFLIRKSAERVPRLIPFDYDYIKQLCDDISKAAEKEFDPHDLRRSFGHRLHMAGKRLEDIAKLMRHESPDQAFKCYIGWNCEEFRAIQDSLCPAESIQALSPW